MLDANPQLIEQGATVDDFLKSPFNAGWDGDGDGYRDRTVNVQVYTHSEMRALLSPAALRSFLEAASLGGVSVKRAQVAKQPALLASDVQEGTRDDGTQAQVSRRLYFFRAPKGIIHIAFLRSDPSDRDFDQMTRTMINSVRPLR